MLVDCHQKKVKWKEKGKVYRMNNEQSNAALPPKTCTIDRLITVPTDVNKALEGKKTATRRNGRYADIGEIMVLENQKFRIDDVYQQTLGELTDQDAQKEGFTNLEDYKQSILAMHPGMPWAAKMKVWVHEFSKIDS
ncbi:ASCH domain-containing protein [Gracilibacillus kekensis]|uniref:ASCH domain-containing protein n=2 Tax=Gracilibacillus kekensis TaxID=1027249 RepID=A0A1M7QAC2_9BACI|nr:ASCH domain-containing protein [Gracilibacillus kekensis]